MKVNLSHVPHPTALRNLDAREQKMTGRIQELLLSIKFGYWTFMGINALNLKQVLWPLDIAVAETAAGTGGRPNIGRRREEQQAG